MLNRCYYLSEWARHTLVNGNIVCAFAFLVTYM
jgi:hypothetical protein